MVAQPQNLEAINNFTSLVSSQWSVVSGQWSVVSSNSEEQRTTDNGQLTHSKQWKKALEEYANRIEMLLSHPDLKLDKWQRFGEILEALESAEFNEFNLLAGECYYRAKNYEQAVRIWEACGAIQKPEYNRAKAMLLGLPEGLVYLAQAGEHDSITLLWEQAGKPRDRLWLQYVASALEANHQYQQALVVYVWLDELVKVKQCFEAASQGAPSFKPLTVLLQYFYRKKNFTEAIEAIQKYLPTIPTSERLKAGLKSHFVYELACSELISEEITKEQRKRYQKFIKEQVLSTPDWQQYLSMPQVGLALEKLGSVVETLQLYEQFVSHPNKKLQQFARDRWIATKKKQEDYARNQGQIDKAEKTRSELLEKAANWSISPQSVPLEPPLVPRQRPTIRIPKQAIKHVSPGTSAVPSTLPATRQLVVTGLSSETKVEQLGNGVIRFGVRHLVIKLMKQSKQVLITDALNGREVRVDGAQCQVTIGDATVEAAGSNQLSFALSSSGYRGSLVCNDPNPRLELDVQGWLSKISIEL
jgi:tetratricopeptide (TPR) repeat protein